MENTPNTQALTTPQAIDVEQAVLGAMILDKNAISDTLELLSGEVFYKDAHRAIFNTIRGLFSKNEGIDVLTISDALKTAKKLKEVGGDFYLIELTQKVMSSAHIEFHCRILLQKYMQREVVKNANKTIVEAYQDDVDVFSLLDTAYNHLNKVSEISIKPQESLLTEIIDQVVERGVKIYKKEIKPGIETPIKKLTNQAGGWRNGELIIMAARPGMGKTSFALLCVLKAAKEKIPAAFFSLEMNKNTLASRILSMECLIDLNKFMVDGLNPENQNKIREKRKEINELPLFIDDTAGLSIEQFQVKAKRLKNKNNVQLIIVDYLQLMSAKAGNREQEISKISRGLKKVALDLNIPIIALSQLSRAVETRGGNKRPQLSDLRESGAIEQDADIVTFFYRPEYYGITEWDDYNNTPTDNQAEYIVAKNRNGGLVRNIMNFQGRYTLFSDIEEENNNWPNNSITPGSPDEAFEHNPF